MSQPVVIRIENLGKRYRYGVASRNNNLRAEVADWMRHLMRPRRQSAVRRDPNHSAEYFWALEDFNLEVHRGEVVGIIGRNGAGKSTLLKILARITLPTTGRITYSGRVASLLEVGTGFHRELTGRENVFLNGSILGMRRGEIAAKFDEIIAFSGVEKFIDTPVKFYSSGMYVRLAFAVAAHLEPEILLVDEVLAVGDISFQEKSLGKMNEVAKQGRTVLFVSHNMGAMQSLTTRCAYLKDGQTVAVGPTADVVKQYLGDVQGADTSVRPELETFHRDSVQAAPVRFNRVWVNNAQSDIPLLEMGEDFTIFAEVENSIEIRGAVWGVELRKKDGTRVTSLQSIDHEHRYSLSPGRHMLSCRITGLPTTPGEYLVTVGINQSDTTRAWDVVMDYPLFHVTDTNGKIKYWRQRAWGAVHWDHVAWGTVA